MVALPQSDNLLGETNLKLFEANARVRFEVPAIMLTGRPLNYVS
jgi:hypothetical protein